MARRQSADPLERYDTPPWITRALIAHGPVRGRRVLDPMAGCGAMSIVLEREAGCTVASFDIEPRHPTVMQADTMTPGVFEQFGGPARQTIDVITNPPFSLVAGLWRRVQTFRRVALLARITWLEKTRDRADVADPVRVIVLPRPKFIGKGSDSATVCWLCWGAFEPGLIRLSREDCRQFETAPERAPEMLSGVAL